MTPDSTTAMSTSAMSDHAMSTSAFSTAKSALLIPYTFVIMNWAAMKAFYCFLRGFEIDRIWTDDATRSHRDRALSPTRS